MGIRKKLGIFLQKFLHFFLGIFSEKISENMTRIMMKYPSGELRDLISIKLISDRDGTMSISLLKKSLGKVVHMKSYLYLYAR